MGTRLFSLEHGRLALSSPTIVSRRPVFLLFMDLEVAIVISILPSSF